MGIANLFGNRGGGNESPGQQQQTGTQTGQGEGEDQLIQQQEDEQQIDPMAELMSLFKEDGGGQDDSGTGGDKTQNQNQNTGQTNQNQGQGQNSNGNQNNNGNGTDDLAQGTARELTQMIQGLSAPKDLFPQDFDPSNPQHMQEAMTKLMQHTTAASVQAAFKPMEVALRQLATTLESKIESALSGFGNKQTQRQILERVVPEVADKDQADMVNGLFNQAMKRKGATPEQAAQTVRKIIDSLGGGKSGGSQGGDAFSGGFKTGKDALDMFAPLPSRTRT